MNGSSSSRESAWLPLCDAVGAVVRTLQSAGEAARREEERHKR